ncbi:acyltransferase family protein [Rhodopseudomonas telluris]|uniref:Acyltransferase family protein n=1 Tax=Rhodopseudomonas telluris TaxID=644215 RepID=A0ABV6F0T5_9BRAD
MGTLRLLLALSVLFAHGGAFPITDGTLAGGRPAVQSFYIISGFYMALILTEGYRNLADFYFNRFLRLFPTYWGVLAISMIGAAAAGRPTFVTEVLFAHNDVLGWDSKLLMLCANLVIFGSNAMMFLFPSADGLAFTADFQAHGYRTLWSLHQIPQAWTLPIEMMFYAIAPFLVKSWRRLLLVAGASIALRLAIYSYVSAGDPWTYRFFPTELAFFCAGSLAFHAYRLLSGRPWTREAGLIAFVTVIIYVLNFERVPGLLPDTPLIEGRLLQFYLAILASLPFVFEFSRSSRADRWIGELSYPVYLVHYAVILAVSAVQPAHGAIYYVLAISLLLSVAINALIYDPIETHFKRRARRDRDLQSVVAAQT